MHRSAWRRTYYLEIILENFIISQIESNLIPDLTLCNLIRILEELIKKQVHFLELPFFILYRLVSFCITNNVSKAYITFEPFDVYCRSIVLS